ncbi:hypothetical protein HDV06_005037 [Boothiomyces sp. JEL0866]|nr:hypothetical protein HDV06_005037 [Boothiomyces sp. JEL0866]
MKLACALLFHSLAAFYVLESQYLTENCKGLPPSLYVFNEQNFQDGWYLPNETWSPFYIDINYFLYDIRSCGYLPEVVHQPYSCCYTSLNTTFTYPYVSGAPQFFNEINQVNHYLPKTMLGEKYCRINRADYSDNTQLYGYSIIYLQPQADTCVDDWLSCSPDGVLTMYNNSACSGFSEKFNLNDQNQTFTSIMMGDFIAQFDTIKEATMYVTWQAYFPYDLAIPYFNKPGCVVALAIYCLCILFSAFMLTRTVYTNRANLLHLKPVVLLTIVCQTFWFVWPILKMIDFIDRFSSYRQEAAVGEAMNIAASIATLCSIWITNTILFSAFQIRKFVYKAAITIAILLINISLDVPIYYYYWSACGPGFCPPDQVQNVITTWAPFKVYWIFFMLLWNSGVPIAVSMKVLAVFENGKFVRRFKVLQSADPYLIPLLIGNFFCFVFYLTSNYLNSYSAVYYDDFVAMNMSAYNTLALILHSAFTVLITQSIKRVSQLKFSTSMQASSHISSTAIGEKEKGGTPKLEAKKSGKLI